ncbi:MAG: LysM peptidoglycan-binding domain-containing protein [Dehalococcoidia bacterium]|nr:LysM peptidoglycan-binding domain-containing protein [Dehalococcoidia bacterium]
MNTQKQTFLIVVLSFLFVGACAGYAAVDLPIRAQDQQKWHEEESIERGALLYANNCRTCHGNEGQGGVGLPLNTDVYKDQDPLVLANNREKLTRTLNCGRAGTAMQPWLTTNGGALNERQIEHLVNFITAPGTEESEALADLTGGNGTMTNKGWEEAVHFAEVLNSHTTVIVGGETLDTIAADHLIGADALSEFNSGVDANAILEEGTTVRLPGYNDDADGYEYKVINDNETIAKIADSHHVGAIILAELNNLPYEYDKKQGRFTLLDAEGAEITGLFPGDTIALPEGARYIIKPLDTLQIIADKHGLASVGVLNTPFNVRVLPSTDPATEFSGTRELLLGDYTTYIVQPGDALGTIATKFGLEVDDLIQLNSSLTAESTLTPGDTVEVGDNARYFVSTGDTLATIAQELAPPDGIQRDIAADLARLNSIEEGDPFGPSVIIELPKVDAYTISGQSLEELAEDWGNVTADTLAEANGITVDSIIMIGQSLHLPHDAWGNAASNALNPGTACVQYTVPEQVFETLPGIGTVTPIDEPAEFSQEVSIDAGANDWTLTADGTEQPMNEGVAKIAPGTSVAFTVSAGIHNITINGNITNDPFRVGDEASVPFDTVGEYDITCTYHPAMFAKLFVREE